MKRPDPDPETDRAVLRSVSLGGRGVPEAVEEGDVVEAGWRGGVVVGVNRVVGGVVKSRWEGWMEGRKSGARRRSRCRADYWPRGCTSTADFELEIDYKQSSTLPTSNSSSRP